MANEPYLIEYRCTHIVFALVQSAAIGVYCICDHCHISIDVASGLVVSFTYIIAAPGLWLWLRLLRVGYGSQAYCHGLSRQQS